MAKINLSLQFLGSPVCTTYRADIKTAPTYGPYLLQILYTATIQDFLSTVTTK